MGLITVVQAAQVLLRVVAVVVALAVLSEQAKSDRLVPGRAAQVVTATTVTQPQVREEPLTRTVGLAPRITTLVAVAVVVTTPQQAVVVVTTALVVLAAVLGPMPGRGLMVSFTSMCCLSLVRAAVSPLRPWVHRVGPFHRIGITLTTKFAVGAVAVVVAVEVLPVLVLVAVAVATANLST